MSDGCENVIQWALEEAGYRDLKEFLLAHSGYTLTEMAETLKADVVTFVSYHKAWVEKNAPDPLAR